MNESMATPKEFHYRSGEIVRLGDRVRTVAGRSGVVKEIFQPRSDLAKQFSCPDGGVILIEDWNGVSGTRVMAVPGDEDWDDVVLVNRAH